MRSVLRAVLLSLAICGALAASASAAPAPFALPTLDPGAGWTNDRTPTLTWSATTSPAGMSDYEVFLDGTYLADVDADTCTATCSFDEPVTLTEGSHSWFVRAWDLDDESVDSGVRYYEVSANGALLTRVDALFKSSYLGTPPSSGDVTWSIVAVDRAGNRSAPATTTVLATLQLSLTTTPARVYTGQPYTLSVPVPAGYDVTGAQFVWSDLIRHQTFTTTTPTLTRSFTGARDAGS